MTAAQSLVDQMTDILESSIGDGKALTALIDFFDGMPEADRRTLAKPARALDDSRQEAMMAMSLEDRSPDVFRKVMEARVASFATTTASAFLKKSHTAALPDGSLLPVLAGRDSSWAQALLDQDADLQRVVWLDARAIVRAGLATKPTTDAYYIGMIDGLIRHSGGQTTSRYDLLLEDPDLLNDEIWRLFELVAESSLATADRWASDDTTWEQAYVQLASEGLIDRDRLLDACISALQLDFNHFQAKWFLTTFDQLAPTDEELRERAPRLYPLTNHAAPNVAKWAFTKISALYKAGSVQADERLIESLKPLLVAKAKGTVKQALSLLAKSAKANPDLAHHAALAAVVSLAHEEVDAQEAAWKLLAAHEPNPALADAVRRTLPVVAATLAPEIESWLNADESTPDPSSEAQSPTSPETGELTFDQARLAGFTSKQLERAGIPALLEAVEQRSFHLPATRFDGTDISRLNPADALAHIDDLDSLVATCARVLEDGSLVDDLELAIDGIARLHAERPKDFEARTSPLRKRLDQIGLGATAMYSEAGAGVRCLCQLLDVWLNGASPQATHPVKGINALSFLWRRNNAVAERVAAGTVAQLLGAPTHKGGWIDPVVFVARANDTAADPDPFDLHLALLRLAPDNRAAALHALRRRRQEWVRAAAYALGGRAKLGENAELWITASRARSPFATDKAIAEKFPGFGPDSSGPAEMTLAVEHDRSSAWCTVRTSIPVPKRKREVLPSQLLYAPDEAWTWGLRWGETIHDVPWIATIWPGYRESFFALGVGSLSRNLDWAEVWWPNARYLDPLFDPSTPLHFAGLRLLGLGLAAKEAGERGLATDAAISAIDDGRLGTDNLGLVLTELLHQGAVKPPRWATQVAEVASVSELHAHVVYSSLLTALRGDPKELPRGYGKLIELALQLAARLGVGVTDPGARTFLESIAGSSKTAKAARQLRDRDAGPSRVDLLMPIIDTRLAHLETLADAPTP